ncbi:hypothetical protein [Streptomyces sp. NRRL S-455]|uniref:hypothetical protein n=1 Tax=Streptomyces sp. NRRL S-455 TaxID=1463908 RepID=UPI0004C17964|nr:hypothetical protein [Streptomyces sp. NRRL S-455]
MSRQVQFSQPADPGSRFAPDVFDSQIGKTVPMNIEGQPIEGGCKIIAVEVAEDGASATFTAEVPDGALPSDSMPFGVGFSD